LNKKFPAYTQKEEYTLKNEEDIRGVVRLIQKELEEVLYRQNSFGKIIVEIPIQSSKVCDKISIERKLRFKI